MDKNKKTIKEEKFLKIGTGNSRLVNSTWIIGIIILIASLNWSDALKTDLSYLIKVICAIFALLISVVVYSKIPNIKNDFVKYIGIGFLYLGLIDCIDIFLRSINLTEASSTSIVFISSAMESLILLYAVILHKKGYSVLVGNILFSGSIVIMFIASEWMVRFHKYHYLSEKFFYINLIICVVLMVLTICLLKTDDNIIISNEKKWLIRITVLFSVCDIINLLSILFNEDTTYIQHLVKFTAYVISYKYVEAKLLKNGYRETLYKLISIQETGKILNNNLVEKEKLLKESQMNIKKGEEQYKTIIESISDGIFIFENNNLMYANEYGIEYLRYKLDHRPEKISVEEVLKILTNENIDKVKIRNGFNDEFQFAGNDSTHKNITITLKSTKDTKKILLVRDSTGILELKKLREEREKVKVTEVIKDEFYSNISHELRTPINVVNSALQLNNLMLDNRKLDGMVKNNNIIRQNCLRLIRTVNNFIDTNRISEGFLEPNKKVYNIVNIVESVVLACNKYMVLMDNRLIFDTELEEIYTSCDKEHIERIMLNILSNSLKYGKVGGEIDVTIKSSKREVIILVKNDAPPVPKEQINIIFEKFTKLDSSLARPSEGSGLGLYLTKELVELNGGVIKMSSIKDVGNVFEIRIPFIFSGEPWEVNVEENPQNLDEKVNIEFSDIYFN